MRTPKEHNQLFDKVMNRLPKKTKDFLMKSFWTNQYSSLTEINTEYFLPNINLNRWYNFLDCMTPEAAFSMMMNDEINSFIPDEDDFNIWVYPVYKEDEQTGVLLLVNRSIDEQMTKHCSETSLN